MENTKIDLTETKLTQKDIILNVVKKYPTATVRDFIDQVGAQDKTMLDAFMALTVADLASSVPRTRKPRGEGAAHNLKDEAVRKEMLKKLVTFAKASSNKEGIKSSEFAEATGLESAQVRELVGELIASGKIRKNGDGLRSKTRYFAV